MAELPILIQDLTLILVVACITTLIFKKLNQPLVLGYILAGFITGPHFSYTPTVADPASIKVWSDIGVIFLLFSLGLDFSVKKLIKAGGTAFTSASIIIAGMMFLGIVVGWAFGWQKMDSLFLGGMIAMSSTTIIYKAFADMGISQKSFAKTVISILVVEDILAIVLMVLLTTMSVKSSFEGGDLLYNISKLLFFIILWFVVGIYAIPGILKRLRRLMTKEILLLTVMALCFAMVYIASEVGFSSAFGAFVMGSILSETLESEEIEKLVSPIKDLFGAVFFVSVGMMVDPDMIAQYVLPIVILTIVVILGQSFFGTLGVLLSGHPLNIAIQCGFSLTQIGEFAFIIASLGVSLGVTSTHLYPIVVAVSVITTFMTPYMIKLAGPASEYVTRKLPVKWLDYLKKYSAGSNTLGNNGQWRRLLTALLRITVIYSVLTIACMIMCISFINPFILEYIPGTWGKVTCSLLTVLLMSPFLRAIVAKKNHSVEFAALMKTNDFNRGMLLLTVVARGVIAIIFISVVLSRYFPGSIVIVSIVAMFAVVLIVLSQWMKKRSILMERTFMQNLNFKEYQYNMKNGKQAYVTDLLSNDLHITDMEFPNDYDYAGKTLRELNWRNRFGISVVSILRGGKRINIPGPDTCLYPGDKLQVLATDSQIMAFSKKLEDLAWKVSEENQNVSEMVLKKVVILEKSIFVGTSIRSARIRERFNCLVVGIEHSDGDIAVPDVDRLLVPGDILWIVGEPKSLMDFANAGK